MRGKYLSLTSYKRDGTPVATPLWFVEDRGRFLVSTGRDSWKVKRIRRNPQVAVAECNGMGRVKGEPVEARAELLPESEWGHAGELMAHKYRVDRILILPIYNLVQRLRGRRAEGESVYLAITPLS